MRSAEDFPSSSSQSTPAPLSSTTTSWRTTSTSTKPRVTSRALSIGPMPSSPRLDSLSAVWKPYSVFRRHACGISIPSMWSCGGIFGTCFMNGRALCLQRVAGGLKSRDDLGCFGRMGSKRGRRGSRISRRCVCVKMSVGTLRMRYIHIT